MMLIPAASRQTMLAALVGQAPIPALTLHLYTNNKTPLDSDTAADFEEAAPGYGYAQIALSPNVWEITPDMAVYPELVIGFLGALGNVYGYYVTHAGRGTLLWAERFSDGPYNIANNGDQIKLAPRLALS